MSWYSDLRQKIANVEIRIFFTAFFFWPFVPYLYGKYAIEPVAEYMARKYPADQYPPEAVLTKIGKPAIPKLLELLKKEPQVRDTVKLILTGMLWKNPMPELLMTFIGLLDKCSTTSIPNNLVKASLRGMIDGMTLEESKNAAIEYVRSAEAKGEIPQIAKQRGVTFYSIACARKYHTHQKLDMPGDLMPPRIKRPAGKDSLYRIPRRLTA